MGPPDTGLFYAINRWPQALGPTMRFFSEAMNFSWVKAVLGLLVLGMIAAGARSRRTVVQALFAVGIANGSTDLLKAIWPMHRPFQELDHVILWVGTSPSHGTASAHSANMAAVAFVFTYHLRWWGSPWVAVAAITGFSRVFVGAHYPYQVMLGWTCGILAGLLVTKSWDMFTATRRANQDSDSSASNQPEPEPALGE